MLIDLDNWNKSSIFACLQLNNSNNLTMVKILSKTFFLSLFILFISAKSFAFYGYEIKFKIDGFDQKELYLGYYFGDKQYIKDTTQINDDGYFVFKGDDKLDAGVYLAVLPPDNKFIQFFVHPEKQHFTMETKMDAFAEKMKVTDSPDNALFYDYMKFLSAKRPQADKLRGELKAAEGDEAKKSKLEAKLNEIDKEVRTYQDNLIKNNPETMTAAVVRANMPLDYPEFGEGEDAQVKAWRYTQKHYFDHIDLADPRMLRTPFLFQRVDHFINKLTIQHPDTINLAIDYVLKEMEPAEETYRFYLVHFLNTYAKSKVVGFDAIYVNLALNYYKAGKAPWTDDEQLKKIIENGEKLEPLLIGKIAPNIEMQTQTGDKIQLHDFKAPYTVLFFWDPECGHCKKATPHMLEFSKKYKEKGVEVFAICTALVKRNEEGKWDMEDVDSCWDYIKENGTDVWFQTVDPFHRSRYKSVYDIRSTPQIYILDDKKEIISKKIGGEQIEEVMEHILKTKEEEKS